MQQVLIAVNVKITAIWNTNTSY